MDMEENLKSETNRSESAWLQEQKMWILSEKELSRLISQENEQSGCKKKRMRKLPKT